AQVGGLAPRDNPLAPNDNARDSARPILRDMRILERSFFALLLVLLAGAVGCEGSTDSTDDNEEAKLHFWDAMGTGKVDLLAPARDELIATFATHQNDVETARLIGMSYLGLIGERAHEKNPPSLSELPTYIANAGKYLQLATEIAE